jgi:hydrogenase maturation protein HypF
MADNQLDLNQVVIGVSFDGSGYGEDGAIWGGEFLLAGYQQNPQHGIGDSGYRRIAHLSYMPLPGGDAAIRRPSRIALAYLWRAGIDWNDDLPCVAASEENEREVIHRQLESGLNVAATSSMGRLFDAVASLIGVRHKVNFEAQAAIELEALAVPHESGEYPFKISQSEKELDGYQIDVNPVLESILKDLRSGVHISEISARFHNSCARLTLEMCRTLRSNTGLQAVALSGGVWQNSYLLKKTIALLEQDRFTVYLPQQTPVNDGGLSLGQAIIAGRRWINQEKENVSRDSR